MLLPAVGAAVELPLPATRIAPARKAVWNFKECIGKFGSEKENKTDIHEPVLAGPASHVALRELSARHS